MTARSILFEPLRRGLAGLVLLSLPAFSAPAAPAADAPAPAVPVADTPAPAVPAADTPTSTVPVSVTAASAVPVIPDDLAVLAFPKPTIPLRPPARVSAGDVVGNALQTRATLALEKVQDGQALLDEGQKDAGRKLLAEATEELEAVFKADPSLTSVWSTLGWCYWLLGRPAEAESFWALLVGLDPQNARAFELLGSAKMARKELVGAALDLKRSLQLDPASVGTAMKLGMVYRWLGRYPESVEILRKVCRENPARMDAQDELAVSLYFNANYVEAAPLLAVARTRKPDVAELVLYESRARLESGDLGLSESIADEILASNPTNVPALLLRAEAYQLADRLPEAAADLEQAIKYSSDPIDKAVAASPLVRIQKLLWQKTKDAEDLNRALALAKEMVEMFPKDADWRLLEAELALLGRYYDRAKTGFSYVLDNMNTNNFRALLGLMDANLGLGRMGPASKWNDRLQALNPLDCYDHDRQVRFELAHGNMRPAYAHARKLEEAGAAGAVAILTYRGLRKVGSINGISEARFVAHMKALRAAGYRFIKSDEVSDELRQVVGRVSQVRDAYPDRVVAVCLDAPDEESLRLAERVSQSLRIPMSMFLKVSDFGHPASTPGLDVEWLKQLFATGRWSLAVIPSRGNGMALDAEGNVVQALANRIIRPDGRLETLDEFTERVQQTYATAYQTAQNVFPEMKVDVCAYPYGNIGQAGRSNTPSAVTNNLTAARGLFEFGVIPSSFGHAVRGSDSLWQHMLAPDPEWSGEVLVTTLLENHPVHLARRLYSQVAVLDARYHRAKDVLQTMADTRYPQAGLNSATAFMRDRIAVDGADRITGLAVDREREHGRVNAETLRPTLGAEFTMLQTSIEDDNVNYSVLGSLTLLPTLRIEGRAGRGRWRQDLTNDRLSLQDPDRKPLTRYAVDSTDFGLEGNLMVLPPFDNWNPLELRLEWLHREFTGDTDWSVDRTVGELGIRPILPVYMTLRLEHDVIPSARSVVENTTYDLMGGDIFAELRDGWLLNGGFKQYNISDDNERQHLMLRSMIEVWENYGFWLGAQAASVDADHYREEYWTPYKYVEYGLVLEWKRKFPSMAFDIWCMFGRGREDVRPEDVVAYDELRQRAIRQRWINKLEPMDEKDWEPVFSGHALGMFNLTKRLDGWIQVGYTDTSSYDEFSIVAGLYAKFY